MCQICEGSPSSKVTQIPQCGEKREREGSFLGLRPSMMRNDGKKKEVWVGAGVGVGRRVVVVGDPGWSGKRNVGLLECLEQSGIIE